MNETLKSAIDTKDELMATLDGWGESNPETNSTIAGFTALVGGIVALNVAPALFVTGSVVHTLFAIGQNTQKATEKRWTKPATTTL